MSKVLVVSIRGLGLNPYSDAKFCRKHNVIGNSHIKDFGKMK